MDVPISTIFDDVYFSRDGGLEETRYVFLEGNRLFQRWIESSNRSFVIAETGFGTGLNFLATIQLWMEFQKSRSVDSTINEHYNNISKPMQWLHFISVEGYPLTGEYISKYLSPLQELSPYLGSLISKYKIHSPGFYRFQFPEYSASLTILYGLAEEVLPDLSADVDAWFLDGFSPAKNPDMWSDKVFQEMARLSHKGTTFSTYTSSGYVRKGLESVGFLVKKIPGFGKKREMSIGEFKNPNPESSPLHSNQSHSTSNPSRPHPEIHIAGAGIAGASLSYALNLRGISTRVYDGSGIASRGSGNPAGIFYPYLTKHPIPASRFSLHAFFYALNFFNQEEFESASGSIGLDFLLGEDKEDKKYQRYANAINSFQIPHDVASLEEYPNRIFFRQGRTIYPKILVKTLLNHPLCTFIQEDLSIHPKTIFEKSTDKNIYVFCNSYSANKLKDYQDFGLPQLKKVRGQIAIIHKNDLSSPPNHSICSDSYITPMNDNFYIVGSTYDEFHPDRGWSESEESEIMEKLEKLTKLSRSEKERDEWLANRKTLILNSKVENEENTMNAKANSSSSSSSNFNSRSNSNPDPEGELFRVSHRAQSRDRLPVIGKVKESWIFSGLGSRGLVSGLLGGELMASLLLNEPLPIPLSVYQGVDPIRFLKSSSKV